MAERNVDKIKRLEHELGRFQKKVADDAAQIHKLKEALDLAYKGNQEMQLMVDALMIAATLQYGVDALDPDDETKVLGKRLVLDRFDAAELHARYEIRARKDAETDTYVMGVIERESVNASEEG